MPMYQSTILPFNHCHTPITCFDPHKLDLQRWGGQGWPCEHLDCSRFSPRVLHGFSDAAKVRIWCILPVSGQAEIILSTWNPEGMDEISANQEKADFAYHGGTQETKHVQRWDWWLFNAFHINFLTPWTSRCNSAWLLWRRIFPQNRNESFCARRMHDESGSRHPLLYLKSGDFTVNPTKNTENSNLNAAPNITEF